MIKNLPAKQEKHAQSLGWEDHLEKEMATHSSILAWEIPRTEEPGRLQSVGLKTVRCNLATERAHRSREQPVEVGLSVGDRS